MSSNKKVYKLKLDYHALDILMSQHLGRVIRHYFPKGETVIAAPHDGEFMVASERFLIPLDYLETVSSISILSEKSNYDERARTIKEQAAIMSDRKLKNHINHTKDTITGIRGYKVKSHSKTLFNGVALGFAVGLLLALYFKKKVLIYGGIGAVIGGFVADRTHNSAKITTDLLNKNKTLNDV